MNDPRITTLAKTLIDHSCRLKAGQKVLIEAFDLPEPASGLPIGGDCCRARALPVVSYKSNAILRSLYKTGTEAGMKLIGEYEAGRMEQMDAYIGIRGAHNSNEFADVPPGQMDLYQEHWWQPVHIKIRVPKTRWVVLRYPTDSMAQAANMSSEAFEDFYFNVCTTDYAAMAKNLEPLKKRMEAADKVRIIAPGTDLIILHPGHSRGSLRGRLQHSRWGSFHGPCAN